MVDLAIIMSIYHNDRLEFVRQAVQSVLGQTFTRFHYYLAIDGPVKEDVDNYLSNINDERIRLYRLEKNGGLAGALNFLLERVLTNTQYKFIARMDADDISEPSRVKKQHDFLLENTEISCLGSWFVEIDGNGELIAFKQLPVDHESLRLRYFTRTPFAHPSVMFRRELIEKAGFYPTDTILMEDNVLWGKALAAGLRFANLPEYLLKFRKDEGFYKRRSGFKYGWNYIRTRFKVYQTLNVSPLFLLPTIIAGIWKMMPPFIVRIIS